MILQQLADTARKRVAEDQKNITTVQMRAMAEALAAEQKEPFRFYRSLSQPGMRFICEVKKASPSKGLIAADFPYLSIAREYEEAGAAAISVLTEPSRFLGSDAYLQEIAAQAGIPVLRKDFTVDAYQIYQAKVLGAEAVLLICALLDTEEIGRWPDPPGSHLCSAGYRRDPGGSGHLPIPWHQRHCGGP